MRPSTITIDAALEKTSVKMTGRITAYKSRIYFEEADLNATNVLAVNPLATTEFPIPEAFAYNTELDLFLTVSVGLDGSLILCEAGGLPVRLYDSVAFEYVMTDGKSRPGIYENYVFYFTGTLWKRIHIDMTAFHAGTEDCLQSSEIIGLLTTAGPLALGVEKPGAIHPVSATEFVLCYIDEGAIGMLYGDMSDDSYNICTGRVFHPTVIMDETIDADLYATHYSGAVAFNSGVFVYTTSYDGEVKVANFANGNWSDILTAIPSDISTFSVNSVLTNGTAVFICGTFRRREEFSSDAVYTILSKSTDGFTFALDRKTLCSILPYRFLAAFDGTSICFSSANRFYKESAHFQLIGEATQNVIVDGLSISGSASGFQIKLRAGKEEYYNHAYVREGFYSKLEVGVHTTLGVEYITYHDTVIASVTQGIRDGDRQMDMQVVPDARWHTAVMTYPFYMEMIGKGGKYDPTKILDNLYKLTPIPGADWAFSVDLWGSESPESANSPKSHAALASNDHVTVDLKTIFTEYPVFGDDASYEVHIYGWSRAGLPDTNPNTADPTTVTGPNDNFTFILEYEDVQGNTFNAVVGVLSSTYANPPQTYFTNGVRAGSYPVTYTVTNPGAGCKIKRVGVSVDAGSVATVYYIERIEMPNIIGRYIINTSNDEPSFTAVEAKTNWALVQKLTLQVGTNNASNGNAVSTMSFKNGYCYAFAISGSVQFDRGGNTYIQDAEWYCSNTTGATEIPPTWTRKYPPGSGPNYFSAVDVTSPDFPLYGVSAMLKHAVQTSAAPSPKHAYLFKHADLRFGSSQIKSSKIPYVYCAGTPMTVALYLAGSGTISNIQGGAFQIYVFESPVPFDQFGLSGGIDGPISNGTFEIVQDNRMAHLTSPYIHYISMETEAVVPSSEGGFAANDAQDIVIRSAHGVGTVSVNIIMDFTLEKVNNPGSFLTSFSQGTEGSITGGGSDGLDITSISGGRLRTVCTASVSGTNTLKVAQGWWYPYPLFGASVRRWRQVQIDVIPALPVNNQVPVPPSFNLSLGADGSFGDDDINKRIETRQKGVPQIVFSTTPYSAWNFEATCRIVAKGAHTYAGVIGIAEDENNFLVGYYRKGKLGIGKVRGGSLSLLYEEDRPDIEDNKSYDLRFWNRDGLLGLDLKRSQDTWSRRSSATMGMSKKWMADWGPISTSDDIFHVGLYAFINPPKFRTTGYLSSSPHVPVAPLDKNPETGSSDLVNRFPNSGKIDIEGVIYEYTNKTLTLNTGGDKAMGPFQIRNNTEWVSPFNTDRNGYTFVGGKAIEVTQFAWWDGTGHALDYASAIVASSSGYSWLLAETQWKVWITTGGEVVWLRNRARYYAPDMPDYYPDGNEKIYITDALSGVTPKVAAVEGQSVDYMHPYGAFAYLDDDDSVSIHGFSAYSGNHDQSVRYLLEKFCKIAGTESEFIGDAKTASKSFIDGEVLDL